MKESSIMLSAMMIISVVRAQSQCVYNQPYIAYGDNFKNSSSSHLFTIGLVSRGNCIGDPVLTFDGEAKIQPTYSSPYQKSYGVPEVVYIRKAYFWLISKEQAETNKKWKIVIDETQEQTEAKLGYFEFPTRYKDAGKSVKVAIVADMDITPRAMKTVEELASLTHDSFDMVVHDGDMAYDIHDQAGMVGDYFFNNMSRVTTRIPYSPIGGNHEILDNGGFLNYRFRLPGGVNGDKYSNKYYSYDIKNTHFLFVDFDYIFLYRIDKQEEAFQWIYNDLKTAYENPDIKWTVFTTHRPFYCSEVLHATDCTMNFYFFRKYEALLEKFKVDLVVTAHLHAYMRNKIMHNFKPIAYPKNNRTQYPVHVIVGHSGTKHFFNTPKDKERLSSIPFVEKVNNEHATWIDLDISDEQMVFKARNAGEGTLADEFTIKKYQGGSSPINPYLFIAIISFLLLGAIVVFLYSLANGSKSEKRQEVRVEQEMDVSYTEVKTIG